MWHEALQTSDPLCCFTTDADVARHNRSQPCLDQSIDQSTEFRVSAAATDGRFNTQGFETESCIARPA